MADDLGSAVLRLTLDDSELRSSLQQTERVVRQTTQRLSSGGPILGGGPGVRNQLALAQALNQTAAAVKNVERSAGPILGGGPAVKNQLALAQALTNTTRAINSQAQAAANLNRQAGPILGGGPDVGAQRQAAAAAAARLAGPTPEAIRRRRDITSNALIGGAFPLLFGQGLGASFGGAAGGGLGGAVGGQFGFGLSLLGTAVGAQFDAIIQKATLLGQALSDPIKNFEALRQGALLSSRAVERQAQFLISAGREAEAAAIIQQDLARSYGGAENARALAAAQDQLNRSWTQLSVSLGQLGIPLLATATADAASQLSSFLEILRLFADLRLPEFPGRLPTAAEASDAAFRVGRATAAGGAPGLFSGLGSEVLRFFGANRTPSTPAEDAQVAKAAATQKEIEAIQTRRLALQKQIAGATGDEQTAAAENARAQDAILGIREAQLQAANKLRALPASASLEEFNAAIREARADIEKARIEFEKLVSAQNNAARLLRRDVDVRERTTGLAPSARQGAELVDRLARARAEYDKAKAATEAAVGDDAVRAAQAVENNLGQAWRSARQDVADYNAELTFTIQRQSQVNALALAAVRERISSAQALIRGTTGTGSDIAGQVIDIQRGALEQRLGIRSRISEARRAQFDIGQQLDTARQRGDVAEFQRLLGEQEIAAQNTRLALIEGADALTQSSRRLLADAKSAVLSLTEIRSDPQGLNRFLDPGAIQNRAQADFSLLLPQFREAQGRFRAVTGFNAPEFTGPTAGVNTAIRDFIASVNREFGANETLAQIQKSLADSTSELARINTALVTQTARLADKDWSVYVNGVPTTLPAAQQNLNNAAIS